MINCVIMECAACKICGIHRIAEIRNNNIILYVCYADIPFAPSCVRASHITSDSALISWLPCNSNFAHVVAVNSVEVRTLRGGVYKHLITGLSANTLYRVSVRAKPGKLFAHEEKNPKKLQMLTTYVDFRTLPKSEYQSLHWHTACYDVVMLWCYRRHASYISHQKCMTIMMSPESCEKQVVHYSNEMLLTENRCELIKIN